jgi:Outer membrane lipoprotein carrier protein LolA.
MVVQNKHLSERLNSKNESKMKDMKRLLLLSLMCVCTLCLSAQDAVLARKILDKTASVVGRAGGATASFKISNAKVNSKAGTIAIKGTKFHASTPQAIVWFDGKTQWSYLKTTNEVNISTPTEAKRMSMNPYTFITMYKSGYTLALDKKGKNYVVHMTAENTKRSVQEVYITIDKRSYIPSLIKMRQGNTWTNISVYNFVAKDLADSQFVFNAKDFPKAEVIDLR